MMSCLISSRSRPKISDLGDLLVRIRDGLRTDQYIDFSLMIRDVVEAVQNNVPGIANCSWLFAASYGRRIPRCESLSGRVDSASSPTLSAHFSRLGTTIRRFMLGEAPTSATSSTSSSATQAAVCIPCRRTFGDTQPIVEASDGFVTATLGPSRIAKVSRSCCKCCRPKILVSCGFPDRAELEAQWVAGRIRDMLGTAYDDNGIVRGLTPADFAVLMRSTRAGEQDGTPRHGCLYEPLWAT